MGTREADQPVEQWAGPESLDPTPVWKQYVLVALLLFLGLAVVIAVSVTALAPQFVTPPALVPGDRLVLSVKDIQPPGATPIRLGAPLVDDSRAFWLVRTPGPGLFYAFLSHWAPRVGERPCPVELDMTTTQPAGVPRGFIADCGPARGRYHFSYSGGAGDGPRGLDQFLVSVSGDRAIVNLSRVIEASERTGGPVPTGIPQPQQP